MFSPEAPEPFPSRVFRSRTHPGAAPPGLVYGRALVLPLACCTLPVMLVTLVAVLQGYPILSYLTVGFPAAVLAATLWTTFHLKAKVAEIRVSTGGAAVRSVWECMRDLEATAPAPVLDVRKTASAFFVAIGDVGYDLEDADWPELPDLLETLQALRRQTTYG